MKYLLEEVALLEYGQLGVEIVEKDDGYYFVDETGDIWDGPFDSLEQAQFMFYRAFTKVDDKYVLRP